MPDPVKLASWKEIAAHLGRDARTAQRWERTEGLPVHRLEHGKAGSVYAFAHELDAWVLARTRPAAPPPRRLRRLRRMSAFAAAAALALLLGWAAARWPRRRPSPLPPPPAALIWQRYFAAPPALAPVGGTPAAMVLAAGGRELYVADALAPVLTVLDAATLRPVASIPLTNLPTVLVASPDGGRVYVGSADGGGLSSVDTRTGRVTQIANDPGVTGLALTPDGKFLYLAQRYDGLARLDTASLAVQHVASVACPATLAMAPDGHALYVGYQCGGPGGRPGHDVVGVFDPAAQRFLGTIGGREPMVASALAVSPDGSQLWASAGDACTAPAYDHRGCPPGAAGVVYVFDTASRRLLRQLAVPGDRAPSNIMFFAGGRRALLDNQIVDTTRLAALEALPDLALAGAVSPSGRRLFFALPQRHAVAAFTGANCTPPAPDLAAWWPGDGTAADARGVLEGQPSPALAYAPARVGQGFRFSGPAATLNLGHDVALEREWHDGLTLAAWLQWSGPATGPVLRRAPWALTLDAQHRLRACFAPDSPCLSAPAPLAPGAWHHVAVVGTVQRRAQLFLDGRLVAAAALPPAPAPPAPNLLAGGGFAGMLDEITVYSRALDAASLRPLLALPACVARQPL